MARKALTNPRKEASQARSRATVDALVEATTRILVREGFDKASTNRIAELAGVSVGSLYQYFPNKEAIVVAVIERHRQKIMQLVLAELAKAAAEPVARGIRTLVAVAIESHRVDPKLHRVLAEQIPRVGKLEKVETYNRGSYAVFRAYLERHRDELNVSNLELAAFICVSSIEAVTHNAVLHHPEMLSNETTEALIDDTTRLVLGYLQGQPAGPT
jgi:AcrR family transcriptional regulator